MHDVTGGARSRLLDIPSVSNRSSLSWAGGRGGRVGGLDGLERSKSH